MKKLIFVVGFIFVFAATIANSTIAFATTGEDVTINAKACYLIDYDSGTVLYKQGEEEKLPVASIVKLMTILLTLENLDAEKLNLTDIVVASEKAASMGGSQVFIEAGGHYTIEDLLKSVIVSSANDASVVLAETIAGSEENFVELMNAKAQQLGLTSTNYCNCTGLPAPNQFSCAKDIAVLLKQVIGHYKYHNYSTIWIDSIKHSNNRSTELVNTNKLIRYYKGCDGGETGSTNEAGYCLAATAKKNDMRLISVVLGATSGKERFAQTSNLLNYGFNNFSNKKLVSKNDLVENDIRVVGGKQDAIKLSVADDIFVLTKKQSRDSVSTKIELPQVLRAPILAGQVVGKIYLIQNDEIIKQEDIVAVDEIKQATIADNISSVINNWKIAN